MDLKNLSDISWHGTVIVWWMVDGGWWILGSRVDWARQLTITQTGERLYNVLNICTPSWSDHTTILRQRVFKATFRLCTITVKSRLVLLQQKQAIAPRSALGLGKYWLYFNEDQCKHASKKVVP